MTYEVLRSKLSSRAAKLACRAGNHDGRAANRDFFEGIPIKRRQVFVDFPRAIFRSEAFMGALLPRIRRKRRRCNSRAGTPRRRKCTKFIPDSDSDFALVASHFAKAIGDEPAAYHLTEADAAVIAQAVSSFRAALKDAVQPASRTQAAIVAKDAARQHAEHIIRKYGNMIRCNPDISADLKCRVRINERPRKLQRRGCPSTVPYLTYLGAYDEGGPGSTRHVLRFKDSLISSTRAKPSGSVRLELFVEWVPQGERIPQRPDELYGRSWYLRSFTRSRFEVAFPVPPEPMLVVYWGRWADAKGNVSGWSRTVVARVEGWAGAAGGLQGVTAAHGPAMQMTRETGTGRRELKSDARFFLAQRQVHERYMEQITCSQVAQLESGDGGGGGGALRQLPMIDAA